MIILVNILDNTGPRLTLALSVMTAPA